jgi:uncharacterized repeat protein (TIGR02543 family)
MFINNSLEDLEPPKFVEGSLKYELTDTIVSGRNAQNLRITWGATDNIGIRRTLVRLAREGASTSFGDTWGTYDAETQTGIVDFLITEYIPTAYYYVTMLAIDDFAGNSVRIRFSDSPLDQPIQRVFIETPNPDTQAPEIDLNRMFVFAEPTNPESPDGETLVTIHYYARDDKSGLGTVNYILRDPQGINHFQHHLHRNFYTTFFDGDPTVWERYTINILLPRGSAPGIWGLAEITVSDKAWNQRVYNFVETLIFEPDNSTTDFVLFAELNRNHILNMEIASATETVFGFSYRIINENTGEELSGRSGSMGIMGIMGMMQSAPMPQTINVDVSGISDGSLIIIVHIKDEDDNTVAVRSSRLEKAPPPMIVTFNSMGGSDVESQTVENGENVVKPTDPTREEYTFSGWYKEPACLNVWVFGTDEVTSDTTLYAKWTDNQIVVLQDSILTLQDSINKLLDDAFVCQKENSMLLDSISVLHDSISVLFNEITNLNTAVTALRNDTANLNASIITLQNEITNLNTTITALRNDTVSLNVTIRNLQNEIANLNSVITELRSDTTNLNATIRTLQNDNANLNTTITALQSENSALQNENTALQDTINKLRLLLSFCDDQDQLHYIGTLYDSISSLNQQLATCNNQSSTLHDSIDGLHVMHSSQINALHDSIGTLHEHHARCNNQNDMLHDSIGNLHQQHTTINNTLNDSISTLNSRITILLNNISALQSDTAKLQDSIRELWRLLNECRNSGTSNAQFIPTEQIQIYPNPANYELKIINFEWGQSDVVELFDMNGRRVFSQRVNSHIGEFTIDMSAYQFGNYILRIGSRVAKVVKQ